MPIAVRGTDPAGSVYLRVVQLAQVLPRGKQVVIKTLAAKRRLLSDICLESSHTAAGHFMLSIAHWRGGAWETCPVFYARHLVCGTNGRPQPI